jgi:hypothetical protein
MELLRKSKKLLLGGLAGSFITLSGPVSPIGFNEESYTLEDLAYQSDWNRSRTTQSHWDFQWMYPKGFVLQRDRGSTSSYNPTIRKAVFRMLKD